MMSEPTVAASLDRMLTYYNTISLTGYPGSGKDTLARELIERESEAGWVRMAYADALKQFAVDIRQAFWTDDDSFADFTTVEHLEVAKRSMYWSKAIREGLQRLGQETRKLDPYIWVRQMERKWAEQGDDPVVITDVRYPNEAKGLLVAVVRPGHDKVNDHESETNTEDLISKADLVLLNDGTPEDLYVKLRLALHARSKT